MTRLEAAAAAASACLVGFADRGTQLPVCCMDAVASSLLSRVVVGIAAMASDHCFPVAHSQRFRYAESLPGALLLVELGLKLCL